MNDYAEPYTTIAELKQFMYNAGLINAQGVYDRFIPVNGFNRDMANLDQAAMAYIGLGLSASNTLPQSVDDYSFYTFGY